jgi:hypothetical protein
MNPAFAKLLKQKRKRTRDPNLPPPPTLLGQVKELRLTKEEQDRLGLELTLTKIRLDQLEARNRKLESSLATLQNWIKTRSR